MTPPDADYIERARIVRLLHVMLDEQCREARSQHTMRAYDGRAGVAVLEAAIARVEAGEHHDVIVEQAAK
jgi:hypothetical protein